MKVLQNLFLITALWFSAAVFATEPCEPRLKKITFQDAVAHFVIGVNQVPVAAYSFENPDSDKAVVIAPGLGDASELLEETIQDFFRAGFSVFILDHRGQGRSKLFPHQNSSHVDNYQHYVRDLQTFVEHIVKPSRFRKTFLFGNSMGGAIGFLFLRHFPKVFSKAVFLSPMFGLPLPAAVTNTIAHVARCFQRGDSSFLSKIRLPFAKNTLTTDAVRFEKYEGFFNDHPEVPGYAPSHNWILEANRMIDDIHGTHDGQIKTPIQIYTAGLDKLVNNKKTQQLAARFDSINVTEIPNSKHGPHFECDEIRGPLLKEIIESFD